MKTDNRKIQKVYLTALIIFACVAFLAIGCGGGTSTIGGPEEEIMFTLKIKSEKVDKPINNLYFVYRYNDDSTKTVKVDTKLVPLDNDKDITENSYAYSIQEHLGVTDIYVAALNISEGKRKVLSVFGQTFEVKPEQIFPIVLRKIYTDCENDQDLFPNCEQPECCIGISDEKLAKAFGDCNDEDATIFPFASSDEKNCQYITGKNCTSGKVETSSCQRCGTKNRTCQPTGKWGDWGICEDQKECSYNTVESDVCSSGGKRQRVCNTNCTWGPWSDCKQEGECQPGQIKESPCGNCGKGAMISRCMVDGSWGPPGPCQERGCTPGEVRTASQSCGYCGTSGEVCNHNCQWTQTCLNETGDCEKGTQVSFVCGAEDKGTLTLTCNASCKLSSGGSCSSNSSCTTGKKQTVACGPCMRGTRTRSCSNNQWGQWSRCTWTSDYCTPGNVEYTDGKCGRCGFIAKKCNKKCRWDFACESQGSCQADREEKQDCGICMTGSKVRKCSQFCEWSNWSSCQESLQCKPGQVDYSTCGQHGIKQKLCTNLCQWGQWGSCNEELQCSSGATDNKKCGACNNGTMSRKCDNTGRWEGFGSCQNTCVPGEKQVFTGQSCGYCGKKAEVCSTSCAWAEGCIEEGVCKAGEKQTQKCGACNSGERERKCDQTCHWGPWSSCIEMVACKPGETESSSEDCGSGQTKSRDCLSNCAWSGWGSCH